MTRVGIIDIGSNSMRLSVVAMLASGAHYVVDEYKSSPRLAAQLGRATGELLPEGVEELLVHLREFVDLCRAYGVERTVVLGTAALRAATNRADILGAVRDELGLDIEVISGQEEAALDYQAVRHTMAVDTAYLVDIGGGSTEITLVDEGRLAASVSLPFGAVTLGASWRDSQALLHDFRLPPAEEAWLDGVVHLAARPRAEVIGIGGTIRSICRVHQADRHYPLALTHNYRMDGDEVEALLRRIADTPMRERKRLAGLSRERADLIVPGGAILLAIMRRTRAPQLRVSGRGIRDGALYTRVLDDGGEGRLPVVERSVENVLSRFAGPRSHASQVTALAMAMFDAVETHGLVSPAARPVQFTAAMLNRVGVYVNYYGYDQHTFYLVLSSQIYGLSHEEVVVAALAASFKSRSAMRRLATPMKSLLTEADYVAAARMGVIARLAEALDRRHEGRVESLAARLGSKVLELRLRVRADCAVEVAAAETLAPHVMKNFGRSLRIAVET
jgi:exopolyphosphatase / guanosine-5'-triphosphate,3'-diphosphate pyrophosphatase